MNATNTNVVPTDNRGDGLYMNSTTKKVQKWVTHFEGKRSKSTMAREPINPKKLTSNVPDFLKRQETVRDQRLSGN